MNDQDGIDIDGNVTGDNIIIGGTQNIHGNVTINQGTVPSSSPATMRVSVFLSYSRADDDLNYDDPAKSFMRRLYNDLTAQGFDVWWDRESLPSRGETFAHEIELAIRGVERFVLVVGTEAVKSDYVRKEWEFGLMQCLGITPILRNGEYSLIPGEIGAVNAIDFRDSRAYVDAFKDLVKLLKDDTGLGNLVNVPVLPEAFYLREKPFKVAHEAMRADNINPVVVSAPSRAVAVYGYGGIGKSTLAAALAADCDIRRRYRDGVIWLTIGQEPNIVSRQIDIGLLFGDSRDYYTDAGSGKMRLSWLLADKKALIVLDDVWDHKVVENFPINGTACRILLTTRSPKIAELIQGVDVRLDLLTPQEGAALIAKRTGGDPIDENGKAISRELDGLTLAISLAAAQIAEGYADSPTDMLRLLKKASAGENPFKGLIVDKTDKNLDLEKSLALSYTNLDPDIQRRFRELGVLVLDAPFDRDLAAAVWSDTDADDSRGPLTTLQRAGLIERESEDKSSGIYTMHRVLRVYAHALLLREKAEEAVFVRYAEAITVQARQFYDIPPEGWGTFEDHLAPHLIEVGDTLVEQYNAASLPNEMLTDRALNFAMNAKVYLLNRRELNRSAWYTLGLDAAKAKSDDRQQSLFLNELGVMWEARGEPQKAIGLYEQSLEFDNKLHDLLGEAQTLINIGTAWRALDDRKALYYLEQALPITRTINARFEEATVLNNIGLVWQNAGEQYRALGYFEQAMFLLSELDQRKELAMVLNNIGMTWQKSGNMPKAFEIYQQALPICRIFGNKGEEAAILNNIGEVLIALKEPKRALEYFQQALPLVSAVGNRTGLAATLSNFGIVLYSLGDNRKALDIFEQALALYEMGFDRSAEAITYFNIGIIYHDLDNLDKAIEFVTRCIELSEQIEHPDVEIYRRKLEQLKSERDGGA